MNRYRALRNLGFGFVAALAAVSALLAGAAPATQGQLAIAPGDRLDAVAFRLIDDKVQVRAWLVNQDAKGLEVRRELSDKDALTWTIEQGDGRLYEDPATGRILFKSTTPETLVVRPRLGDLTGPAVPVGISLDSPSLENNAEDSGEFVGIGGGICGHRMGPRLFAEPVDVRSVVNATVIPLSKTERVVRYAFGEYYSFHPTVGPMKITYNPNRVSEVRLKSLSPDGQPFYPAVANGDLYFIIEMMDSGMKLANWEPMVINATVLTWPPFETPVVNEKGSGFFNMEKPEEEMHRIAYQEFYLYPTREIDIVLKQSKVEDGMLDATFELTNLTRNGGDVRWFFIGDVHAPQTATNGLVRLEGNGRATVTFRTKLADSSLPQSLTLGAVSQSGERLAGAYSLKFSTSEKVAQLPLLDRTEAKVTRRLERLAAH